MFDTYQREHMDGVNMYNDQTEGSQQVLLLNKHIIVDRSVYER